MSKHMKRTFITTSSFVVVLFVCFKDDDGMTFIVHFFYCFCIEVINQPKGGIG